MDCPYCHEKMKDGVIQSAQELSWLPKEAKFKLFGAARFHENSIVLSEHSYLKGSTVVAYCCDKCRKVVIDYSDDLK